MSEQLRKNQLKTRDNIDITICNVVSSYSTRCHLNLRRIAMGGMHVEYKRENNMVNMRLRQPLSTATMWSSGKITCTGATTEPDSYKAARRFCRILQKMKFKVKLTNYRVVNVLATCVMPFDIDLNKIADAYRQECSYEPELHPGATFKLKDLKATLKLFTTGSITLTAPSVGVIQKAIEFIYPILKEFKRQKSSSVPKVEEQLVVKEEKINQSHTFNAGPSLLNCKTETILYSYNTDQVQFQLQQQPVYQTYQTPAELYSNPSSNSTNPYDSFYQFNNSYVNYEQGLVPNVISTSVGTTNPYCNFSNSNFMVDHVLDDFLQ